MPNSLTQMQASGKLVLANLGDTFGVWKNWWDLEASEAKAA